MHPEAAWVFCFFWYVESWQSSSFDMSAVFRFSQGNGAIFRLCREFLICRLRPVNPRMLWLRLHPSRRFFHCLCFCWRECRIFQEHEKRVSSQDFWWIRTIFLCLSDDPFFLSPIQRFWTASSWWFSFWRTCWGRSTVCPRRQSWEGERFSCWDQSWRRGKQSWRVEWWWEWKWFGWSWSSKWVCAHNTTEVWSGIRPRTARVLRFPFSAPATTMQLFWGFCLELRPH